MAREVDAFRKQIKGVGQEIANDILSDLAGKAADLLGIPRARTRARKYTKKQLQTLRKKQREIIERSFLDKCETWLENIKNFLGSVSIKRKNLTIEGNSHLLINKTDRVYRHVKPETRIKHAISTLRTIKSNQLIYNKEIPEILEKERQEIAPLSSYSAIFSGFLP